MKKNEIIKKILIVGGNGFVGRHLIKFIKNEFKLKVLAPNKKELNLLNRKNIVKYLSLNNPNFIINLASATKFKKKKALEKKNQLLNTYKTNVNFANCIKHTTELSLFFGSMEEYGHCNIPKSEKSRTSPTTYYGKYKLKACSEVIKIFKKNKINFVWLRPSLIYGNCDNKNRFLGYIIQKIKSQQKIYINPGLQIRDYLFIQDLCKVVCLILKNYTKKYNSILNISALNYIRLNEIPLKINKILKKDILYYCKNNQTLFSKTITNKKLVSIFPKLRFKSFDSGLKSTLRLEGLISSK